MHSTTVINRIPHLSIKASIYVGSEVVLALTSDGTDWEARLFTGQRVVEGQPDPGIGATQKLLAAVNHRLRGRAGMCERFPRAEWKVQRLNNLIAPLKVLYSA